MSDSSLLTLINGQPAQKISVHNRAISYGDGLFETMLVCAGDVPFIDRHWHRLESGLERLQISLPMQELRSELELVCENMASRHHAVIKLTVTRGEGSRGYHASSTLQATRIVSAFNYPAYDAKNWRGIRAYPCRHRYASSTELAGIKHLNRLDNVLARKEWDDESIAEGLVRNQNGQFVSGCFTNLFLVAGTRLLTPPISNCGVRGVIRQILIEEWSAELGLVVEEIEINDAAMLDADEVFLTNALIGAWPICQISEQAYTYGPVCRQIQARFVARTGIDPANG